MSFPAQYFNNAIFVCVLMLSVASINFIIVTSIRKKHFFLVSSFYQLLLHSGFFFSRKADMPIF